MRTRTFALALALAAPLVGCKQGANERCLVDSDCADGLACVIPKGGNLAEGGLCLKPAPADGGMDQGPPPFDADVDLAPDASEPVDLTPRPDATVKRDFTMIDQ